MGMHGHAWACMGPVYDLYTPRRARPTPRARGRSGSVRARACDVDRWAHRWASIASSMGVDGASIASSMGASMGVDGASMGRACATHRDDDDDDDDDGRRRRSTHGDSRTRRYTRDTHRRSDTRATRATRATTTTTTTTWLGRAVGSVSVSVSI